MEVEELKMLRFSFGVIRIDRFRNGKESKVQRKRERT